MKKILLLAFLLVPVFANAQTGTSTQGTTTNATTTQITCVQTALEKRENSLITGHDSFNTAIKAALNGRLTSLKDAWAQTDKKVRQEKRRVAYQSFKKDVQVAHTNLRTARTTAWKTFDTDMKACGVKGHGESAQMIIAPTSSL